jgi:hypothetical protein
MSNTFDDPNREAVGLPPIWTGADVAPEPQAESPKSKKVKDLGEVEVTPMEDNEGQ